MDRHPIESLMGTTMENIRDMVDVNTVVGDPVQTTEGVTIIPISRVSFGFVAGGGEYSVDGKGQIKSANVDEALPFAGGSGAGVSVNPVGFLVSGGGQVKLLSANYATPVDRMVEMIPQVVGDLKNMLCDDEEEEPKQSKKKAKKEDAQQAFTVTPLPKDLEKQFEEGND